MLLSGAFQYNMKNLITKFKQHDQEDSAARTFLLSFLFTFIECPNIPVVVIYSSRKVDTETICLRCCHVPGNWEDFSYKVSTKCLSR